ncbi:MAG: hypothetical protein JSV62_12840 [Promethearchaeota archaeon]|nr:MAG: hypothetical protein JSV62_12840 [Candidatus Lokiarchaeota archaeon]
MISKEDKKWIKSIINKMEESLELIDALPHETKEKLIELNVKYEDITVIEIQEYIETLKELIK